MLFTQILHVGPPKEPQKSQNRTTANETLKLYAIIHHFKYIQRKVGMPSQPSFPAFYLLTSEDPKLSFLYFFIFYSMAVILQWMVWRKYFEWRIWASLVPIVGGILLTSVTELSFNVFGFCAALFGCLATSTKTILAESLLHGYKFDRYLLLSKISTIRHWY